MTAQIIPFGDLVICQCGHGIASMPIHGSIVCIECATELKAQRACAAAAAQMQQEVTMPPAPSLDEVLARLVNS